MHCNTILKKGIDIGGGITTQPCEGYMKPNTKCVFLFILKQGLYIAYNVCLLNQRILIANNVGFELTVSFEKINQKRLTYINNK